MSDCKHSPRKADTEAGYEACMFCVETGECVPDSRWCTRHGATWARHLEMAGTAF